MDNSFTFLVSLLILAIIIQSLLPPSYLPFWRLSSPKMAILVYPFNTSAVSESKSISASFSSILPVLSTLSTLEYTYSPANNAPKITSSTANKITLFFFFLFLLISSLPRLLRLSLLLKYYFTKKYYITFFLLCQSLQIRKELYNFHKNP